MKPETPSPTQQPLRAAFVNACAGLRHLWRTQRNIRIHSLVAVLMVGLGLWLRFARLEWAILLLAIGMVLTAEAVNTAIEAAIDLVHPDYHPLAGAAKDVAAAAVLLASVVAILIGVLLLAPHLWSLLLRK